MKTYQLFKVHIPKNTHKLVKKVFDSGFINEGVEVTELTNAIQARFQTNRVILTNSCTSAITLALHLANVGSYSDVISTAMTCVATNTPIINLGAHIIWADVDPESGMLTAESIKEKITPVTKAVIVVAWGGIPPELEEIQKLCKKLRISLILDAAHAFDATYQNQPIHNFADFTCYSFQAIKHFTTGDGGALVCAHENDYVKSKALKWFGLDRDKAKDDKGNWKGQQWDVDIEEAGYKFNMNNVSAAIGLAQLSYIDKNISKHRKNAALYDRLLKKIPGITHSKRPLNSHPSFWVYTVILDPDTIQINRDSLLKLLNDRGVHAGVVHVPNDEYTAFKEFKSDLPGVREFSKNQFSLPCGWWLSKNDIENIVSVLTDLIK